MVIYKDDSDPAGSWRVQSIPLSETGGFENRVSIPWRGFRDAELEKESGIPGLNLFTWPGSLVVLRLEKVLLRWLKDAPRCQEI
uniref:Uncharacterized protein n=1 Tax=Ditylenchus dipsaci TaxID=166011 RepID=A0A915EBA5_9BILA